MAVDYSGALAAMQKYTDAGIQMGRTGARSIFDLKYDITEERQDIEERQRKNRRRMKKMKDRMSWANLIGSTIGFLVTGGNPIGAAAGSYLAQEVGQQTAKQPKDLKSGKFFSDVREDYNQKLGDWEKDVNWGQLAKAGMSALTAYQGKELLAKEFGTDWLSELGIGSIDTKLSNMYFGT